MYITEEHAYLGGGHRSRRFSALPISSELPLGFSRAGPYGLCFLAPVVTHEQLIVNAPGLSNHPGEDGAAEEGSAGGPVTLCCFKFCT
jgi:hypothetical protein